MKNKSLLKSIISFVLAIALVVGAVPSDGLVMVARAETSTSTINVGGTDYALYTGFTATAGTASYSNFVDGNMSNNWQVEKSQNYPNAPARDFNGGTEDPAYVEFHADAPIIPKGYVLTYDNTYNENWKPTSWALKAKLNESGEWTTIHSSNSSLGNGLRFEIACTNDNNNQYQYFRFEIYDVGSTMLSILNELQIYAQFTYTPVSARAATCTEYGLTNDGYLRSDGKYFSDENGTNELTVENGLLDKIAHDGVHHDASDRNIEYWQCSMCHKYFTDAACTHEVTADEVFKGIFGTLTAGTNGESGYYTLESKTYTLTEDVNTAGYIYVPEGVTATIDLNGHTIDRGLTTAVKNGMVIWVAGNLTVTDCGAGGTIKGGMDNDSNNPVSCVKVYSDNGGAAFTLQGGTLIGNTSYRYNCAVMGGNNTSITISGGKITGDARGIYSLGNITVSGGEISGNTFGIESLNYSISVSGNPVITNNTNANVTLYSNGNSALTIAGELTVGANIGITKRSSILTDNAPVTITSGYGTYNNNVSPSTYFSLDNDGQIQTSQTDYMTVVMGWNEDRTEVAVGTALYTVNFDMNGHGDAIDAVSVLSGCKLMKPEPTADGWYFLGWYTDAECTAGNEYDFDDAVTSNKTLHAKWTQTAIHSITLPEKMVIVSADHEAVGGKYLVGTVIKFKVSSADYVVDGDVSDGTNTLTPDVDGNYTITMGETDITITATVKKAVEPNKTLSGSESYTANDGDVLTGSTSGTVTIANNAKITLSDVTITGGIVCNGTATITLVGTNSISVSVYNKAGIQIGGSGTTLTIKGNGSLIATGGDQSAGIGLGRTWYDNATGGSVVIEGGNITASGGNGIGAGTVGSSKTATIGDIVIKGGTVNARLGKGEIVGVATANIGAIKIYDTIEKVDASKITESVTYMHDDTDVTASASTYFTIIEDGDRRIITPKDNTDYTITIAGNTEHGTIVCAATTAKYADKITITATPDFGYRLSSLVVKDAQNKSVASTGNSFFMPKSNVTVSAVFEQGTHGTTEFAWGLKGDYYNPFTKEATIYDGVTTVSVSSGKNYTIYNNAESFRLDEDPSASGVTIPYSGGTGSFMEDGTSFSLANNATAGFYDVTMNEAGNGKWSVSIQKTVPAMDDVPDQEYTGSEITPEPLVLAGSLNLTKGTDYEYSYDANTNAGTAKVIVTFKGDYVSLGSMEKEFTIVPHIHNFAYSAGGTTITATCSKANCPLAENKPTLTIHAPTLATYGGTGSAEATLDGLDAFNTDTGLSISGTDIKYVGRDGTSYAESSTAPTGAGAYTASIIAGGKTASVDYTIASKPISITGATATERDYEKDNTSVEISAVTFDGATLTKGTDYTVTGVMADDTAGNNKSVTVTVTLMNGNYTFGTNSNTKTTTVKINKIDHDRVSASGSAKYGAEGMVDLSALIEAGGSLGTVSASDSDNALDGTPEIETDGKTLKFKFSNNSDNVGKTATVTIPVRGATNYKDYNIEVTLKVTACPHSHTELRDVKAGTCSANGYSGNIYCLDCGAMVEKGKETPKDPDNHHFDFDDEGHKKVKQEPTLLQMGITTYTCVWCGNATMDRTDIPCLQDEKGRDLEELREDVEDLSGNAVPKINEKKDDKGNTVEETVTIGGEEVSKIITDPESGKETVESKVWIGGLKDSYHYTGSAIKPSIHVYDGIRKLKESTDYTVKWSKNKEVGTAEITVKFKGNYKDTKSETVKFEIKPAILGEDIIAHETGVAVKKSAQKPVPVLTWKETGKTVPAKNFNVTYNPSEVKTAGTYAATITSKNTNFDGTATALVKVAAKDKVLSNVKVKFDPKSYNYTGKPIEPKYSLMMGTTTLTKDKDYRQVSLTGNTNPGTATIIFEAISGNEAGYVGSKTATFKISGKKSLKDADIDVTCAESVPYAKGGAKAAITVTDKDTNTTLKEGVDYTLSYSKNKAVGTGAEVKVKGKGNYKDTVTKTFVITKQSLKALEGNIIVSDQFTTKSKLKAPSVTIIDIDGKKLSAKTDYTVGEPDFSAKGNTEDGGIVYITITGKGNYSDTESVKVSYHYMKTVSSNIGKTKAKTIKPQPYTGNAVKLSKADLTDIVYTGSKGSENYLKPGTDFTVISSSYSNNVKKGTAKVTIRGIGAYAGTKTLSFKIEQRKVDYKGALVGDAWK